jgi:NAD(P)-dependent dehydrogenase (short-subunit alcohol dehydrogenase family)
MENSESVITGKIALVTGATGGIGRAIALSMADAGADVVVSGRDTGKLDRLASEIESRQKRALPISADLHQRDQVEGMVAQALEIFGRLDILINCAGTIVLKPFLETTIDQFREQMDLHYMATVIACKQVVPRMVSQGAGKIVNISSLSGTVGYSHHSAYSAAKGAVIRFSEAIAEELKPHHINVNCIAPNAVDTALFDEWVHETGTDLDRSEWIQPNEIGELAVYLCSPAARSITGETIVIKGIYGSGSD